MTASEVIEQIKALPPNEQARVVDYLHEMVSNGGDLSAKMIHYATDEQAKEAGNRAVEQFAKVFERLSH